jgi:bifunctional non-homologous end joining protein LigD
MSTATKTKEPIAYAKAKVVYDKLVKEKMAKGYTPGETGTYQSTSREERSTGTIPGDQAKKARYH